MTKQPYAFQIPDSFFLPHKVTSHFYAKVIYTIDGNKVKIEEVGLSPKCLDYINNTAGLRKAIENEMNAAVRKSVNLNNINRTIASAIAPHINY
jgi:hypothetical protein